MHKISLHDLARLALRDTEEKCDPSLGDLVRIHTDHANRGSVIGIVTKIEEKMMCILVNNTRPEWWSRFVKCDILS